MAELAEVAQENAKQIFGDLLAGRDGRTLSQEKIGTEAVEKAARQIGLSEKDVERDVDYEESVRLLSIRQVTEDGVERSYLTWQVVERWGGSGEWTAVPGGEESGDDAAFDFRLSLYRLSQMVDVLEGAAIAVTFVAAAAVAWESGLAAVLLRAAGGAGMVLTSIGISEVIYVATTYWRDEPRTLSGYLFAALDGYLGALAFHTFAPLGRIISARWATGVVGATIPMRQLVAGWLLSRATVGGLSGVTALPAGKFARELVEVLSGDRTRFSSLTAYLEAAATGLWTGAAFEIAGSALFTVLRGQGTSALAKAADVAALVKDAGISPRTWLAQSAGALSRFRIWAYANLHTGLASAVVEEASRRIADVTRAVAQAVGARLRADVLRQVIELAEVDLSREATTGLERMLLAGERAAGTALDDAAAIDVLRRLRTRPEQVEPFLRLLKDIQSPVLDDIVARGTLGDLAEATAALDMSGRLGPVGTGSLLRDGCAGSVAELEGFARGLSGLADDLRGFAWRALLDHRDLVAALRRRGAPVTPEAVAGLGRLTGQAGHRRARSGRHDCRVHRPAGAGLPGRRGHGRRPAPGRTGRALRPAPPGRAAVPATGTSAPTRAQAGRSGRQRAATAAGRLPGRAAAAPEPGPA